MSVLCSGTVTTRPQVMGSGLLSSKGASAPPGWRKLTQSCILAAAAFLSTRESAYELVKYTLFGGVSAFRVKLPRRCSATNGGPQVHCHFASGCWFQRFHHGVVPEREQRRWSAHSYASDDKPDQSRPPLPQYRRLHETAGQSSITTVYPSEELGPDEVERLWAVRQCPCGEVSTVRRS